MKKVITIVFALVICLGVKGQVPQWEWARGGNNTNTISYSSRTGITVDKNNNTYCAVDFIDSITVGTTILVCQYHSTYLAKYDENGNLLWVKTLAYSDASIHSYSIGIDANANVYVSGSYSGTYAAFGTDTLTGGGQYLVKYDSTGNVIYAVPSAAGKMAVSPNGEIFIAGNSYMFAFLAGPVTLWNYGPSTYYDGYLVKYNSLGTFDWVQHIGGYQDDEIFGIAADEFGNCYISGFFSSYAPTFGGAYLINNGSSFNSGNMFVAKFNSAGSCLWARKAGDKYSFVSSNSVCTNSNNKIIVGGNYANQGITGHDTSNVIFDTDTLICTHQSSTLISNSFIAQYDTAGNFEWVKNSSLTSTLPRTVASDGDGNIYLRGGRMINNDSLHDITFETTTVVPINTTTNDNMYLFKFNSSGSVTWAESLVGGGWSVSPNCVVVNNCNVFISGDFSYSPFGIGTNTLINNGGNASFIAKLQNGAPCSLSSPEIPNQQSIEIYPNPATTQLTSQSRTYGNTSTIETIHIYNVLGEMVQSSDIGHQTSDVTLDVSGLNNGIYFIEVKGEKGVVRKKFVKD